MSQEDVDRAYHAKATRVIAGHKSQITRAMVTLDKVVGAGVIDEGDITTVKSAKSMVEKQLAKIEAQSDALLGNDNFSQEDLDGLTDYILDKGNLLEKVSSLLDSKSGANSTKGDISLLDVSGVGAALSESLLQVQARQLSQADLPTFNGEESEYIPFIESFNFLVNENENIPDGMKANYLKRCMKEKGPHGNLNSAYELLKYISPTAENFKLMLEKLDKRFKLGYTSRAIYINKLRKLNTWKPCHSPTELRKLYDFITENLELLKLAGGSDINESDILLADVLSLIPSFIVNKFLELPKESRNLKKLLENMDESVSRMLEKEMFVPKLNKHVNVNNKPAYNNNQRKPNYYNKPYQSYQAIDEGQCLFCGGDHNAFTCNAGSLQDRLNLAREQKLCHNCLRPGHYSNQCRSDCYCKCGSGRAPKHCKALCMHNQVNNTMQANNNSRGRGNSNYRGSRGKFPPRGRGTNGAGGYLALPADIDVNNNALADSECFMEIACGYVRSANTNDDDVEVRLFLDTGSNASFGEKEKNTGASL